DHVHVLFKCTPQIAPAKFINAYKSVSSRLVKKNYPEICQYLLKEAFWTKSYCLISTGGVSIDVIKQYIERQGQK
ncbi:IS200/IS605 family transposase, partial [Ligilactobacillus ruminis]